MSAADQLSKADAMLAEFKQRLAKFREARKLFIISPDCVTENKAWRDYQNAGLNLAIFVSQLQSEHALKIVAPVDPEPCHVCNQVKPPMGWQAFTGRPFCSQECLDKYLKREGL